MSKLEPPIYITDVIAISAVAFVLGAMIGAVVYILTH
jgi:hypothetical protein